MVPVLGRIAGERAVDVLLQRVWRWQRTHPPRVPRGWAIGPPSFVGIGVQKAGTTWWYSLLTQHPEVVTVGHPKELHYFNDLSEQSAAIAAARYARWFPRPPGRITGEWTPRYMEDPHTPRLLALAAPDARLLVMLRDPVERYRSGLAMHLARGWPDAEAVAVARGLYAQQLQRVFAVAGHDDVLVLQYERCVRDTAVELERTFRFLGVDPSFRPRRPSLRINATIVPQSLSPEKERELVERYEPEVASLATLGVELDLDVWPHFSHLRS